MFLIDSYRDPFAGTEKQLFLLIEGLVQHGYHPELTLFRRSDYIEQNGFPCPAHNLDIKKLFRLDSIFKIIGFLRYVKSRGFRIVHCYFVDSSVLLPFFAWVFGIKVIISRRDMGYWYDSLLLFILKFNHFFIDAAVTNSKAVKQITCANEWIPEHKVQVIYNAYKSENLSNNILAVDEKYEFDPDKKYIGIAANIRPVKRIDLLLDAFALVRKEHPEIHLLVVGSGNTDNLLAKCRKLGIEQNVEFLGSRKNVADLIKNFDVGIICSDSEGFSNSIIEYILHEIPVVCTNVGGNPEIIEHDKTGYLAAAGDEKALAGGICKVLDNPEKSLSMAAIAKSRVLEMCAYESMLNQHIDLYNQLVSPT